jgi:chromosome segregation ATPase
MKCDACETASDWVHRRCHHSVVLQAGTYEQQRDKARAEVERLSEENERLKDRCAGYSEDVTSLNGCVARLEAALYEARDEAAKRRAEVARLRGALSDVAQWRESSYGGVAEIEEFAREALNKKNGDA